MSDWYDALSPTNRRNVDEAFDNVRALGLWKRGFAWSYSTAAENFDKRTLTQSLSLGLIFDGEHPLTVRAAFYRGVSAGLWPETSKPHYDQCKNIILKMRRLGILPWEYVADSTRRRLKPSSWSGLADFADTVAQAYRKNLWERQPHYIELFCEKDAMAGIIEPVTSEFDVHLNIIRGHVSETFVHQIGSEWARIEKPIYAAYLGDHDPDGFGIEATLKRKLLEYSETSFWWQRLAITPSDFNNADLIGFPVKKNGAKKRWKPYLDKHGDRCVEVDAVNANEVRGRVRDWILKHVDAAEWQFLQDQEAREREHLKLMTTAMQSPKDLA